MIELFHPEVDETAWSRVAEVLGSKWIGEGPKTQEFELAFQKKYHPDRHCVAVSSGTAALTLAYILAGITAGSVVITPVFTCTATNTPLLHLGARIVFADVERETLNIDPNSVYHLMTGTAAIVAVHYGGAVANTKRLREYAGKRSIIEDAAQCLGAPGVGEYGDYVCYSFQAIKHLTTCDGGMLVCRTAVEANAARRLRWFGIDRQAKFENRWENDITQAGFKFQMTDMNAAVGLANLLHIDERLAHRRALLRQYYDNLHRFMDFPGHEQILNGKHAAWTCTIVTDAVKRIQHHLSQHRIESSPTHYRNDRYSIFKNAESGHLHGMNSVDQRYLLLPLHGKVTPADVDHICKLIKEVC